MALEQRRVPPTSPNTVAIAATINFAAIVENILHVLPETNNIAVVLGASPLERFWTERMRDAFKPFAGRVAFTWLNELSFEDVLKRSATLPPRSAILFLLMSVDAAGVTHEEGKPLDRLHYVANAPIFSYTDAFLGKGIVGGPLIPLLEMGQRGGAAAAKILNGEAPGNLLTPPIPLGAPKFDWREMQRWDISEATLPSGSVIEFRTPTIFEKYKWYIIAVFVIGLSQAFIIAALLFERISRKRAESAARDFSERLISGQEDQRSRLARELHDDVTQRLAALAIEIGSMQTRRSGQTNDAELSGVRQGLVKLSEDVHALAYRLHPSILGDLGLVVALKAECERFSDLQSIPVDVTIDENLIAPAEQIALCIFRIAQEALQNVGRHAKAGRAEVSLRTVDNGIQVCVRDYGVGFDPKRPRPHPSLGLSGMRQRIYLVGGELDIDSSPGHGTIVLAWVPTKGNGDEARANITG